ncbi:SPFH domain-containing protein [Corynebacterium auris]|uniref:SPFH domain-containing protein n=1 Tax=Corynebacterium auris TaxID=44750 RepID=UPI0025B2AD7C|nr:SPFH domain-containing protein [Corynebacterium auris]WJY67018.1 SPFH domain / Band 7 family protein [Corynebacterium auris]
MFSGLFTRQYDLEAWQPSFPRSPVPRPGHIVLRSRNGEVTALRRPGLARPSDLFQQVDQRRRQLSFAPQRIPTAEGLDVTLTFVLTVRVADAVRYVSASADPASEVYLAAQIALRELISTTQLSELIGTRIDLSPVASAAATAGLDVGLAVEDEVHLKDLSLPYAVSEALSQAEVDKLTAAADLERARTEVKITRARLGTAKVLEQNPLLAKIRLLEALPPGTTLEVRDS